LNNAVIKKVHEQGCNCKFSSCKFELKLWSVLLTIVQLATYGMHFQKHHCIQLFLFLGHWEKAHKNKTATKFLYKQMFLKTKKYLEMK